MVLEAFEDEPLTPWQGYGIISDVIVRLHTSTPYMRL